MLGKFSCAGLPWPKPPVIGCQNHVLDLILCHLLQLLIFNSFNKTDINYDFGDDVLSGYEKLHTDYDGLKIALAGTEKHACSDDY